MAKKRRIAGSPSSKSEEKEQTMVDVDLPESYQEMGWKDWLLKVYARYWYVILCLFIDAFVLLMIQYDAGSLEIGLLFVIVAVPIEYLIYRRLWGSHRVKP